VGLLEQVPHYGAHCFRPRLAGGRWVREHRALTFSARPRPLSCAQPDSRRSSEHACVVLDQRDPFVDERAERGDPVRPEVEQSFVCALALRAPAVFVHKIASSEGA
jgi:hypothetical protein